MAVTLAFAQFLANSGGDVGDGAGASASAAAAMVAARASKARAVVGERMSVVCEGVCWWVHGKQ